MNQELRSTYQEQIAASEAQLARGAARFNLISWSRLGLILIGLILLVYTFQVNPWISYATLALLFVSFVRLVRLHERVHQTREQARLMAEINRREIDALNFNFEHFDSGTEFSQSDHPFSGDLDLFGPHSLFPCISRCTSDAGRRVLADWLRSPTPPPIEEIHLRQAAVEELAPRREWRQIFRSYGLEEKAQEQNPAALMGWMQEPIWHIPRKGLVVLHHLLPFFTVPAFFLMLFSLCSPAIALPLLLTQILIVRFTGGRVQHTFDSCSNCSHILESYGKLLAAIEASTYSSERLTSLKQRLAIEGRPASERVAQLSGLLDNLAIRHNPMMHLPLNVLALWDLFWIVRLEKWKVKNQESIEEWLEVVNEFEALCSLANLSYNHPDWCQPTIEENSAITLKAEALGHLLVPQDVCVTNDIEIRQRPHLILITGSNMGGKSTWLRSVGTGVVLALAGGPVPARAFRCARLHLYTSMRTGDSLTENESTFYAELKCLKRVTEAAASQEPTLFLLDEILRGTNSEDRHAGSKALIHQLVRNNGVGLLATHDLELTQTREDHPDAIELFFFEAQIDGDDIRFDYTLRPGVCGSRNAAFLMRRMGIEM
jgi:hypothetical protein